MKMTPLKKILAALVCLGLLTCILAGCGASPATEESTAPTQAALRDPVAAGMLLVNPNATIQVVYDTEGFVMSAKPGDINGTTLMETLEDVTGKSVSEAVKTIVSAAAAGDYLSSDTKIIVLKACVGSTLPGTNFLGNLAVDAESAAKGVPIFTIDESGLDDTGYISLTTAKELLCAALGQDDPSLLEGNPEAENQRYVLSLEVDGIKQHYTVNIDTGEIRDALLSEYDEYYINGVEEEDMLNATEATELQPEDPQPEETEEVIDDAV